MPDYDNNMRGALYRNERKQHDGQPDYRGMCEIDERELQISAWVREIKSGQNAGKKMLSLAFTVKPESDGISDRPTQTANVAPDDSDSGMPF